MQIKAGLIKQAIDKQLFETPKQREVLFELIHSLGTKYDKGILTYANSNRIKVVLDLGHVPLPNKIDFYASPSFIRNNEIVFDGLLNDRTEKEIKLNPTAIFLLLMFPNLYAMTPAYSQRFERIALKAYHKYAERANVSFEKSPKDNIKFLNAKDFFFERKEERLFITSIYSKNPVQVPLPKKTQTYLESSNDLNKTLNNQAEIIKDIGDHGRDNLKSLWSANLFERGQYKKAAYLFVLEGVTPNLPLQILEHHMENGLKEALGTVFRKKAESKQAHLLKKGVYVLDNLLGSKGFKVEEP